MKLLPHERERYRRRLEWLADALRHGGLGDDDDLEQMGDQDTEAALRAAVALFAGEIE